MATHELKTWPEPFQAVWEGRKFAEFRKDDREVHYEVGDFLHLREWFPTSARYSDRMIAVKVTHVCPGGVFGIPEGYVMLSIIVLCRYPKGLDR